MTGDYSNYKGIKVEIEDGVAIATFNRPEVLNALDADGLHELHYRIFPDLGRDEAVKAIILTGAGKAFCVGADVRGMQADIAKGRTAIRTDMWRAIRLLENMLDLEKPIIAAVNGHAAGLGATVALFCDIIIAAETAKFSDKHISVGIVPGDGGTVIWPLLIGPARAKEYLMTGDVMDAMEAERSGLVNKVVPLERLMPTAKQLARRLADGPTLAIAWTKRSINNRIKRDLNLLMDGCLLAEQISFTTEDHTEATRAFLERRKPQFKGR